MYTNIQTYRATVFLKKQQQSYPIDTYYSNIKNRNISDLDSVSCVPPEQVIVLFSLRRLEISNIFRVSHLHERSR